MSIQTTNGGVTLTRQTLTIPTYATAKPEKNPMFLENRAYQGSTGKVYPFPVTERVFDEKHDQDYQAVIYLDNAATTIVAPEVADIIDKAMREHWANPSSLYGPGARSEEALNAARAAGRDHGNAHQLAHGGKHR